MPLWSSLTALSPPLSAPLSLSLHPWASPSEGPGAVSFGASERFNPQSPDPFPTSPAPPSLFVPGGEPALLSPENLTMATISIFRPCRFTASIICRASGPSLGGRVRPAPSGRPQDSVCGLAGFPPSSLRPLCCHLCTGRDPLVPDGWLAFCLRSAGGSPAFIPSAVAVVTTVFKLLLK